MKNYFLTIMDFSYKTLKIHFLPKLWSLSKWKSNSKKNKKFLLECFHKNSDSIFHMFKNISKIIIWRSFMEAKNTSEFFIILNQKSWTKMQFYWLLEFQKFLNQILFNFTTLMILVSDLLQFKKNLLAIQAHGWC